MALINCPECNKEISDKATVCIHCGYPIGESNKNCTIEKTEVVEVKKSEKQSNRNLIIFAVCVCLFILIVIIYQNKPLTESEKRDEIWNVYFSEGYEAAASKTYEYYGVSDEGIAILMAMDDGSDDYEAEIIDKLEITHDLSRDGKYFDYILTLKNNSDTTITYIKYTVNLMDDNGDIINSDWSNWSGTLKPDAQIVTDTMIDFMSGVKQYSVVIDEIKTE